MSSYPPPPPPPQPPYDPNAWRAQQQFLKQQQKAYQQQQKNAWRLQRAQMKAAARANRRGSVIGPALLVILGIVFLLNQTGTLNWGRTFSWYAVWWPGVMIAVGCVLLAEWGLARQRTGVGGPVLGGGVIVLLLFLIMLGWGTRHVETHHPFGDNFSFGDNDGWMQMMGESHEFDNDIDSAIGAGQTLIVHNARGDVSVTGTSSDNRVHVSVHSKVRGWKLSDAEEKSHQIAPVFSSDGAQLVLTVPSQNGSSTDLEITVPRDNALQLELSRGDASVSEIHAPVTLNINRGNIDLNGINGNVTLNTSYDDATVSGHSINGQVELNGRAGDMTFADVTGGVSLNGDFFGSTHLERVNGVVRFQTSRTQFQAARLDGEFDTSGGSELEAHSLLGPVILTTHDRNITLDRVEGRVQVSNRNGSVDVTNAAPLSGIQITNHKGSVSVGIPTNSGFVVDASTRNGDLENDYGLKNEGSDENPWIKGSIAGGGPLVQIVASDGDVTVHKTSVAPLAPLPALPKITDTPPAPGSPQAPPPPTEPSKAKAPKSPKAPKASAKPTAPPPPAAPGGMA